MLKIENQLSKLPILLEVVKAGSIRAAAKELRLTQPSVSRAMSALESAMDIRLFTRSNSGIDLTSQGQEVFAFADRLRRDLRILEGSLKQGEWMNRELVIGAYESIAVYLFPKLIAHLSAVQPGLKLKIRTGSSVNLMGDLRRGLCDVILSVNPGIHPDVHSQLLYRDTFKLYRPACIPHDNNLPLISMFSAHDSKGQSVESYVGSTKLKIRQQFMCESFESAKSLVLEGLGMGILPGRVGDPHVPKGQLVEMGIEDKTQHWRFGTHAVCMSYLAHRDGDLTVQWMKKQISEFMKSKKKPAR